MAEENVKVAVRVRPFNQRELDAKSKLVVAMEGNQTILTNPKTNEEKKFAFDFSYWSHDGFKSESNGYMSPSSSKYADQKKVFSDLGAGVLANAWNGYNATLFAYGQTGSGKSYSVVGYGQNKGIVPMVCEEIFNKSETAKTKGSTIEVTFSMLEIYSEICRDLLNSKADRKSGLTVREDPKNGFYAQSLQKTLVANYSDINRLMDEGSANRTIAATNMNATSSRAHTIVTVNLVQKYKNEAGKEMAKSSIINLVDLAGSERADQTGATGDRLKEGAAINLSLTSLGNVIAALADNSNGKNVRVPYRDSVLTKLLMNALGGNSKTIMIAAISPADINFDETLSTLRYADRAKQIKTKPTVNEDPTEKLINDLKAENDRLKKMLAGGGGAAAAQEGGGDGDALKRQLEENEKSMKLMQQSYEEKLAAAHAQTANLERTKIVEKSKTMPSLKNINMDPQLSGTIIILLESQGVVKIGKQGKAYIGLSGVGIMDEHASLTNQGGKFTLARLNDSRILVNGKPLTSSVELAHMDRLVFGTSQYYIFNDPSKASKNDPVVTFESMQDEIGKASGIVSSDTNSMTREQIQCQNEVMDLLPEIEEANHISIALDKKVCFTVLPVAPEARGDYSDKVRAYVAIKNFAVGLEWIWTKEKFLDRKADMMEMYQDYQEDKTINRPKFKNYDPFAESPDTPFQIGTVMIFPKTFAYMMENHGDYKILNLRSKEAGSLNCDLVPCNDKGEQITPQQAIETFAASAQKQQAENKEDQKINDPQAQLLGRKINFLLRINELKDLPSNFEDVYCQFSIFNDKNVYKTQTIKGDKGFKFNFSKMFSFTFDQQFLDFLMNKALFIQIWAEQKHPKADPSTAKISTKEFFERERLMTNRLLILGGAGVLNSGVDPEKQKLKNDLEIAVANNQRNAQTIGYLHRLLQVSGPNPIPPEAIARVMTAQNEQELDQVLRQVYEQAKARGGANMVPPQQVPGNQFQFPPGMMNPMMMINPMMNQVFTQHLMSNPAVVRVNYGGGARHNMHSNSQACAIL